MITSFQEYTFELNDAELAVLPTFIEWVKTGTDHRPLKAPALITKINVSLLERRIKYHMTEERFRKFVNYVRSHGVLPLIATSHGYFVSYEPDVVRAQMKSLRERAGGILAARAGLASFTGKSIES